MIANIARYHRKAHPTPKHLPFSQLSPVQQDIVRKLSAILRVADALDYGRQGKVRNIQCRRPEAKVLSIQLEGAGDFHDEIRSAADKAALMDEVYGLETIFQ